MNQTSSRRRVLHLVVEGAPSGRVRDLQSQPNEPGVTSEVVQLTEANAREALEKIFAADTVAVWGGV